MPYKQKAELTGELMRREKNMKKPDLMQETVSTRKPRQKKRWLEGEKRENRYD